LKNVYLAQIFGFYTGSADHVPKENKQMCRLFLVTYIGDVSTPFSDQIRKHLNLKTSALSTLFIKKFKSYF